MEEGGGRTFCLQLLLGRLFPRRRCDNSSGGLEEMASALYLAAPGGCGRAPSPDCFVWLPVVDLLAALFKRHCALLNQGKRACEFFSVCRQLLGKVTKIACATWAHL